MSAIRVRSDARGLTVLCLFAGAAAVFSVCAYRAATQPITVDEAHVYLDYIHGGHFSTIFTNPYDSANHVLQTILAYGSVRLFGVSELAVRLPSLIGAFLFLAGVWQIVFFSFRRIFFIALGLGLSILNPLVLDHLCLARGYGIALALFTWSLYFSLKYTHLNEPIRERKYLTGSALLVGLSVAANLVFTIPGIGLILVLLWNVRQKGRPIAVGLIYILAGLIVPGMILMVPLSSADLSAFYFGMNTFESFLEAIGPSSLMASGLAQEFPKWMPRYPAALGIAEFWILPSAFMGIATLWIASLRGRTAKREPSSELLRLTGGSLVISVLILLLGHSSFGLLYPYHRTGLYILLLFPLALLATLEPIFDRNRVARMATIPVLAGMTTVLIIYCLEFNTDFFIEWPFASDTKRYLEIVERQPRSRAVRIGGSFAFSYLVNFYREYPHRQWIEPLDTQGPKQGYDYYVLLPEDRPYIEEFHLTLLMDTGRSLLAASGHKL